MPINEINTNDKIIESDNNILEILYNKLIETGTIDVSIRDLCKETGLSMGSLYYWFDNKDDLIVKTAEYGLQKILDAVALSATVSNDSMEQMFESWIETFPLYMKSFSFIHQVASDPKYSRMMNDMVSNSIVAYDKILKDMSSRFSADSDTTKAGAWLLYSSMLCYAIWGDKERFDLSLDYLRKTFKILKKEEEEQ